MKVYLDDVRQAPEGWVRTYTVAETIELLKTGEVVELSLDHDLAPEHYAGQLDSRTGYAVVAWIRDRVRETPVFRVPKMTVHSMNPVGREHMLRTIAEIIEFVGRGYR